jgi:hypothetical protein
MVAKMLKHFFGGLLLVLPSSPVLAQAKGLARLQEFPIWQILVTVAFVFVIFAPGPGLVPAAFKFFGVVWIIIGICTRGFRKFAASPEKPTEEETESPPSDEASD